ncbi:MAG: SDR family oxidoreductase [Actinobacteria bacterium]|nr:SDR family oxidoreductase [Actinomycetota bacterium]
MHPTSAAPSSRPPWWRGPEPGRRLLGARAFVTGAGTQPGGGPIGIGEAIAVLFAAQGARVAVADIDRDRADATVGMVRDAGGDAVAVVGDLADPETNRRCVSEAAEGLGGIDTVVNSVAVTAGSGSPVDVDLDEWDRAMRLNLGAAVLTARHTIPHLRAAGGGAILNISSIAATRGHGSGAYAASKAALGGLTRDWAYLHGREGIRVNEILIGHAYSPMGDQGGPEVRARRRRAGLLPTEGLAWDVAWPAVFLCSAEAGWITGVELPVDAGTTSTAPYAVSLLNDRDPT